MSKVNGKDACTMTWVPTIKEAKEANKDKQNVIIDKLEEGIEKLYWMYYIHLPYYLMTSFDSFCLHVFFLTIFCLSIFGVIKYCFL
ncbi:hypothetical protein KAFR_0C00420 [Kazachstania africana CBS 2517]|uniref:Transmembrane protein n=1 Tax=Kazachstania africana (strain ATCC 22294 / BCRC 22015 / CBS 2517 / CECT 1963 / NBRC 1671 / NRRL Y-8276) TaxID=1071382 RepID=H2ARN7_KAZAF|nr:hypothetical protein KAFR_0C00420 [Kazachstania africana CBS 2517]CCF57037.1 hypothetical protein KAFR_0C00420 [Kazachstania africana CBS 2517]